MEMMLRCALEKYFMSGRVPNELAAIKKFNAENLGLCPKES